MPDLDALLADLAAIGLDDWQSWLAPLIAERLSDRAHGHLAEWRDAVARLPDAALTGADPQETKALLLALAPWRKGPFDVGGVHIDAEWRSDLKWQRLAGNISPLANRNVLDVGCGNGYYALRMLDAGATRVIGIDPTVLFVMQFEAIRKLTGIEHVHVLPLRLEDLPPACAAFDTTFSMGVLYHRRDPAAHLRALFDTLRPGGELVLETLVIPGSGHDLLEPGDRYARMRNVWHLPTTTLLESWLGEAGFMDSVLADVTPTTSEEQRTTEWMTYESLREALDPGNPSRTVEGLPAPHRAILSARRP